MKAIPPPPCRPGDRVGIAALSGPIDATALERGSDELRSLGYEPVLAGNLADREGLFAGDDRRRLEAFHELVRDERLAAIVFARGGHGVLRILPKVDWGLLARRPRAYVGYSDLTPFLHEVVKRLGIWSFHGPMAAVDLARGLDDVERESFVAALEGKPEVPDRLEPIAVSDRSKTPRQGTLLGGCLSLLVSTLGTPFQTSFRGCFVLVEDVGEPLYRRDRLLTHLGLSGSLIGAKGILAGYFSDSASDAQRSEIPDSSGVTEGSDGSGSRGVADGADGVGSRENRKSLGRDFDRDDDLDCGLDSKIDSEMEWRSILRDFGRRHAQDVFGGLEAGHDRPNLTLPLGARIEVDPAGGECRMITPIEGGARDIGSH